MAALVPITFFLYMYVDVITGGDYYDAPLWFAYLSLMGLEMLWAYYIYTDWKHLKAQQGK